MPTDTTRAVPAALSYQQGQGHSYRTMPSDAVRATPPYLSNEIVANILLKMTASVLLRLRCVCKDWRAIIAEPLFVKKHREIQIQSPNNRRLLLAYIRCGPHLDQTVYSVRCAETGWDVLNAEIPIGNALDLVGSCHGLVCMANQSYRCMYLCNPITRQCRRLPDDHDIIALGIGFDASTDDYKVVKITRPRVYKDDEVVSIGEEADDGVVSVISVYSVRSKRWRLVTAFRPGYILWPMKLVSLNGQVHWIGHHNKTYVIVCFNLATEKLAVMKLPAGLQLVHQMRLQVLKGCIAVVRKFDGYKGGKLEMWVMNEYGVEESWSKLWEIGNGGGVNWDWWSDRTVLGVTENGKVLMETHPGYTHDMILSEYSPHDIILYDPTSQEEDRCLARSIYRCEGVPYVECLTSV